MTVTSSQSVISPSPSLPYPPSPFPYPPLPSPPLPFLTLPSPFPYPPLPSPPLPFLTPLPFPLPSPPLPYPPLSFSFPSPPLPLPSPSPPLPSPPLPSPPLPSSDDHRLLVPPACGASLAALYSDTLPQLQKAGKLPPSLSNIVVIVCGGSGVNLETVQQWKQTYNL